MAKKNKRETNALGEYLEKRSINKAEVCRKTGIHPTRMTWLTYESIMYIKASELQLIAKAIKVDPGILFNELFGHLELTETNVNLSQQEKTNLHIAELVKAKHEQLASFELTTSDINRIGSILSFSTRSRTDDEILAHLGLKRKSSNFVKTLKACVTAGWLDFKLTQSQGEVTQTFSSTVEGEELLQSP